MAKITSTYTWNSIVDAHIQQGTLDMQGLSSILDNVNEAVHNITTKTKKVFEDGKKVMKKWQDKLMQKWKHAKTSKLVMPTKGKYERVVLWKFESPGKADECVCICMHRAANGGYVCAQFSFDASLWPAFEQSAVMLK